MIRMLLLYLKGRIDSFGKRIIFDLLKDSPEIEDWIASYSYNLPSNLTRIGKEIDFLGIVPIKGLFVLN